MIKEVRETPPFLHLGFGKQTIETHIGFPIIIWQDNIYKEDEYTSPYLLTPTGESSMDSVNKFEVEYLTTGVKTVSFSIVSPTSKSLQSNEITIVVKEITWESEDIFFNNENVTFNSL